MTTSYPPGPAQPPAEPMYTSEFAQDPHAAYARWRAAYGSLVPVELAPGVPATLVVGYATALRILNDPAHFPADPRGWQTSVDPQCPILPMMEWRPNALRSSGHEHARYRAANVAAIDTVDLHGMRTVIEKFAEPLIEQLGGDARGRDGTADLLGQYIYPLIHQVLAYVLGFDDDTNERVSAGMALMFDATADAAAGNAMLIAALVEHIERKRVCPGSDITSRMLGSADLSTEELIHQLVTLHGAGSEPQVHLISNALLLMMTDDRFAGDLIGGSLLTRDALDEVLFTNPPLANFCTTYPPQPTLIEDTWLPAHRPVVISMAACNADPSIHTDRTLHTGNRSHLAWSAGPHRCPAQHLGYQIAIDTIDYLLDVLPDLRLAVATADLDWRPGPFHRALTALPVTFPRSPHPS
ncbi:cytochrome P450 [Nocardia sp. NPDC005978]|uniref:cytochrome P450 n=1 Tax=Nocardia sp. NPDC005978 TaxID=3156725 RepID=UPI0033B08CAB